MRRHIVLAVAGSCLLAARPSAAMPPFARLYETACTTCHTQPPQLNAFGEAFRANGYTWPEDGDNRGKIKDDPVVMAADANREAFPHASLPSDIPHLPAIGFQAAFFSTYNPPNGDGNVSFSGGAAGAPAAAGAKWGQLDWRQMQAGVDFFVIGRAAPHLTYFAEIGFDSPDMVFTIERAMFVWSNIAGTPTNLKVGRFEPEVSFLSGFRKLVGDSWDSLSRTIGEPSGWALEPEVLPPGAEVSGNLLCGRLRYNVGALTNYTGPPASHGGTGAGIQNDSLDAYVHVATKIGGLRMDGVTPPQTDAVLADPWVDDAVWLGAYAFRGKHDVDLAIAYPGLAGPGSVLDQPDTVYRVGADAKFTHGSFWLIGALSYEHHALDAVAGGVAPITASHISGTQGQLEAEYIVYPWLIPYLDVAVYRGDNPYLVNGGWGAVQEGAATMPVRPDQTPGKITEWTVRPAVSVHLYMNWKLFAYAELARYPLKATLQAGDVQAGAVVVGSKLAF